jgi:ubiquinone/menaquinone biosynthesis C-methylase UbiE
MLSTLDNVEYVSADLQSRLAMVKTDICKMPFPSESFDAVFCMHVLEYVSDDRQGIAELFRVMKPEAWAIVQVPIRWDHASTFEDTSVTRPSAKTVRWPAEAAVRHYGRDFTDRLVSGGFTVDVVSCLKNLSADTIAAYGLKASDDRKLWVCTKR